MPPAPVPYAPRPNAPFSPLPPLPQIPPRVSTTLNPAPPDRNLESRIGSQWLNRIGITAVLIGISYFLKFAFDNNWIGPAGRVAMRTDRGRRPRTLERTVPIKGIQSFLLLSEGGWYRCYVSFALGRFPGLCADPERNRVHCHAGGYRRYRHSCGYPGCRNTCGFRTQRRLPDSRSRFHGTKPGIRTLLLPRPAGRRRASAGRFQALAALACAQFCRHALAVRRMVFALLRQHAASAHSGFRHTVFCNLCRSPARRSPPRGCTR